MDGTRINADSFGLDETRITADLFWIGPVANSRGPLRIRDGGHPPNVRNIHRRHDHIATQLLGAGDDLVGIVD
ncbi:MAG: hypothetical protein ACRD1Q_15205, partial [Vicinamibacterales bacterium]